MSELFDEKTLEVLRTRTQEQNTEEEIESYSELLVGDGKKYKDIEALAKGNYNGDKFIEQLKAENQGLREQIHSRETVEELYNKLRQEQLNKSEELGTNDQSTNSGDETEESTSDNLTLEQVKELMVNTLNERDQASVKVQNRNKFEEEARKALGDNYKEGLVKRASELGLSDPDWLNQMAETRPDALVKILQLEPKQSKQEDSLFSPPTAPRGMNTTPDIGSHTNDVPKYSDFKKAHGWGTNDWNQPSVQNKLFQLTEKYGEAFLDS